ncbi:hypothetical protein AAVH_08702 [Aphelenchoides avenae]|nr:hypothetical protein AAVH_08702 [Aphelenchus avenae]
MESSEFLKANKERVTDGQNEPGGSEPFKASDEPKDTYEANPGRSINLKESKFLPFYESPTICRKCCSPLQCHASGFADSKQRQ